MQRLYMTARHRVGLALLGSSAASIGLYIPAVIQGYGHEFSYLPGNLALAWTALLATLYLERVLQRSLWSSWLGIAASFAWLFLLPNTFYMISDYVHLRSVGHAELLYDVAMFSLFILNSFTLGILSLFIIHTQLAKRISNATAFILIELIILACSFGIYIGRELRWNTWDIVANFSSVVFDVSDRLLNPASHPQTLPITISFFVLLSSVYIVFWNVIKLVRQSK